MRVSIINDKAGYHLYTAIKEFLVEEGHEVIDLGLENADTDMDFPDAAIMLCDTILNGSADRAIMVAGTGVGASIACNKIPGIRASMVHDWHCAHQAVEHDFTQVMCIGGQIVGPWLARDLVKEFLSAQPAMEEKFIRCVDKLNRMDGSAQ